jgi:hypothetical protein
MLMLLAAKSVNCVTACRKVLFEKLIVPQVVKKIPAFYGTLIFNTALERAQQLSLS